MPKLTIRFTGMCVFVRHPNDDPIEVRFLTAAHGDGGHDHTGNGRRESVPGAHQHVPVLWVSPESWLEASADGETHKGRAPGRPVYLAPFQTVTLLVNGAPLTGRVAVTEGHLQGNQPVTAADWSDFDLVPTLEQSFPDAVLDLDRLRAAAPLAPMTLRSGKLAGEPCANVNGEGTWAFLSADKPDRSAFMTDVAAYSLEVPADADVKLMLEAVKDGPVKANDLAISLRSDRNINVWIVNEPPISSFLPASRALKHFNQFGAAMAPTPSELQVVLISTTQNPDERTCPPSQVRKS